MECYDCDNPAKIILGEYDAQVNCVLVLIPLCKEHAKIRAHTGKNIFGADYVVKDGDIYEEIFEKKKPELTNEEGKSNR